MRDVPRDEPGRTWWRDGTLYQIYPRSFADSDGDGIGDLAGITAHLDHVRSLGVDGIWLSPWFASPNVDWGYDVADFTSIHPELGSESDAASLIAAANERGLHVVLDIVPNHTSDRHPWFVDSRASRTSQFRDWYVWADGSPDGGPPNNWVSSFGTGRSAWEHDDETGQWYLCHFTPEQPDLNWWNPAVADAFDEILRFWFDRGVSGFRIDVCHMIVKDSRLRDNPVATADDPLGAQLLGQRQVFNSCRPELHDVLRRWRRIAESYDPARLLLGETVVFEPEDYAGFFGDGDELNTAYSFQLLHAPFTAEALAAVVDETETVLPTGAWPSWPLDNHDNARFPTRWCEGRPERMRLAWLIVLTLRGTPLVYYGDEIGMPDVAVPRERMLDPVAEAFNGTFGRDGCRTPMQWSDASDAGFGSGDTDPWLPFGDMAACNVAAQEDDPDSLLNFTRDLLALRRGRLDLHRGDYSRLTVNAGLWAYRRGEHSIVVCNLSDESAKLSLHGKVVFGTDRSLDGSAVRGELRLAPWAGVIVDTGS